MTDDKKKLLSAYILLLTGIVGIPYAIYTVIHHVDTGWVCYSRHGHILTPVSSCKFDVFMGLGLSILALIAGLYGIWWRDRN